MNRFYRNKWLQGVLLAAFYSIIGLESARSDGSLGIEDFRRSILAARVARVLDSRLPAIAGCPKVAARVRALREEFVSYKDSGTPGLISLMSAYALTGQLKSANTACTSKITAADARLLALDREKFRALRIAPALRKELDPWCASGVQANFNGQRDGNPCFAGEAPILGALRDAANHTGRTYFESGAEVDSFLRKFGTAANAGDTAIDLGALFSPGADAHNVLAIFAYLYAAGTSELGWVDGFGESFWRTPLDQGASPVTAIGNYLSWLNRKDYFVVVRKSLQARKAEFTLYGHAVEGWNHHEFISAFLACNYRVQNEQILARTVPEALGIAYEGRDLISHLKEDLGFRASVRNFSTDVARHEEGGKFGRRACAGLAVGR